MTFEDLYCLHKQSPNAVPKTTFRRCYQQTWSKLLKIRNQGQHARCATCAKLSEERKKATDPETKDEVTRRHNDHVSKVMADRSVATRGAHLSEEAARKLTGDGANQVLKITVDGMDQAKFRCPRNLCANKDFEKLWRTEP